MQLAPSFRAAMIAGAIATPVLLLGYALLQRTSATCVLLPVWCIVAFLLPGLYSSADLTYLDKRRKKMGFEAHIAPSTPTDIWKFHIPSALRLLTYFVSGVASVLLLRLCGIDLLLRR